MGLLKPEEDFTYLNDLFAKDLPYTEVVDLFYEDEPDGPPERSLLGAVLERAISDGLGCTGNDDFTQKNQRHAYHWLVYSTLDDDPPPFSFKWVCMNLDLDPTVIRSSVIRYKKSQAPYQRQGRHRPTKTPLCE